ncbi:Catechol 2,3-dioxygenase [Pseudovibrio denitrificans]|uniref:Catechol 2,3-dioxygenase n=1 Tax=Pseudovibrio denitrificans TaxID=258256 RepID=A0A1I7D344_9HYPH|nr:VOC family protein [Pseudovibrio denitrificans]SFU06034.1 Catechol 2,3-dioxygenase [Pseudovibrio denitrificans]
MKLTHINLVARDAKALAAFYEAVFQCKQMRPAKVLSGEKVSKGNGLPNSEILSIWLTFPDCGTPFLELHQHAATEDRGVAPVNATGFGHLAFQTPDLHALIAKVLSAGGSKQGEVTNFGTSERPHLICYMRDPQGNILELEQPYCTPEEDQQQPSDHCQSA